MSEHWVVYGDQDGEQPSVPGPAAGPETGEEIELYPQRSVRRPGETTVRLGFPGMVAGAVFTGVFALILLVAALATMRLGMAGMALVPVLLTVLLGYLARGRRAVQVDGEGVTVPVPGHGRLRLAWVQVERFEVRPRYVPYVRPSQTNHQLVVVPKPGLALPPELRGPGGLYLLPVTGADVPDQVALAIREYGGPVSWVRQPVGVPADQDPQ